MLLRRVIEHVRKQEWTAISIDFVIVVIGVFVGIQVSNWNEERATRQQSASFTAQLKADLRHQSWLYQFLLEYHRDVRTAAEAAAGAITGEAPLPDEAFLINAYRASQYKQNSARRSTYDEMVSTGNLRLIADRDLRQMTGRVYSVTTLDNLVREGLESRYREHFRMSVPTAVQRALGQHCGDKYIQSGDYTDFDKVLEYPCSTGLPAEVIAAAAQALRIDPQTLRYLRLRIADLDTRLADMTGNNRDIHEFLLDIAKEQP